MLYIMNHKGKLIPVCLVILNIFLILLVFMLSKVSEIIARLSGRDW